MNTRNDSNTISISLVNWLYIVSVIQAFPVKFLAISVRTMCIFRSSKTACLEIFCHFPASVTFVRNISFSRILAPFLNTSQNPIPGQSVFLINFNKLAI